MKVDTPAQLPLSDQGSRPTSKTAQLGIVLACMRCKLLNIQVFETVEFIVNEVVLIEDSAPEDSHAHLAIGMQQV